MAPSCFLAQFRPDVSCEGRLIHAHLIKRQTLMRECGANRGNLAIDDSRSYVWACGGIMGNAGHHGMLDASRTLRIPRTMLPAGLEVLAQELGLLWWLEREYGPLPEMAAALEAMD